MRTKMSIVVIIGCLLLCSLLLTFIHFLLNLDTPGFDFDALIQGRILHVFFTPAFWSEYPTAPHLNQDFLGCLKFLIDLKAALLTIPIILGLFYCLTYRRGHSFLTVGLLSLLVALVPYFTGYAALMGNTVLDKCGPWMAVMTLGVLYAVLACIFFASLQVLNRYYSFQTLKPVTPN